MTSRAPVSFRPFDRTDLAAYAGWFKDEEVARRVSFPDQAWVDYVMSPLGIAHAVVALHDQTPIAVLQYDDEPDLGINLLIAVDPARRGQGFGKLVLAAFAEHIRHLYAHIDGHIEDDNFASIACVERCGFTRHAEDADEGFLHYRRLLSADI
ncbi:GNAT family N-acetyltransferase [Aminobacter sp. AP02]|uniref:GNAT family N-acetyltransferase n=1 Tax=Aminobacter sp. AP02 TaxID=2135737 RepID=UPI000D6CAE32|nr:GNAT family N-acetyltransferase [Aminobacter sp. AP02]PWK67554.1 acetyltransferase (GNAT) family protein [Aminobacter sp. AP02]